MGFESRSGNAKRMFRQPRMSVRHSVCISFWECAKKRNNGTELLSFRSLRALKRVGGDLARGRNRRLRTALGHCELLRRGGD